MLDLVIAGRARGVGNLPVSRLLPVAQRRTIGPFIFLDHMGPVRIEPGVGFDVLPHPHIGLSTLTYMLAGINVHRDSIGSVQVNRPGDVNLMTAGRGVVHSERAEPAWKATGGLMHGVQIWIALPEANEDDAPAFEHVPEAKLPAIEPAPGVRGRVLAGEAYGARSPLAHPSRPLLVDIELAAGARLELPAADELGVFVISGELRCGEQRLVTDQLGVLSSERPALVADSDTRAMVLGGPAIGKRFIDWNFVASSQQRIDRAREDWKAQRFPLIATDHDEHTPYPDGHRA